MPVRRNVVIGALLIGMLAIQLWSSPAASAGPRASGSKVPAVAEQGVASVALGSISAPGVRSQLPPTTIFNETTAWYSLTCVWSVCDTLFSLTALQHFSTHGYLAMLQFDIWHPQVRAAIAIYSLFIDTLADTAMLSWPLLSIETVTSSVQWLGYSIGLYTVGF